MFFSRWSSLFYFCFTISPINNHPDQYFKHYEQINYPYITVKNGRNTTLKFRAFDRTFHLTLIAESRILNANAKSVVYDLNSTKFVSSSDISRHLVAGYVEGCNDSSVVGYIFEGLFVGIIKTKFEIYYVERAKDFLPQPINFESIIYRHSDVNITINTENYDFLTSTTTKKRQKRKMYYLSKNPNHKQKSRFFNRRSSGKSICTLRIIVDHVFCQKSPTQSLESIISYVGTIISNVNNIFRSTDFDDDGKTDDIGFEISEIVIWWNKNQIGYPFKDDLMSSEKYLDRLRRLDGNNDVCLVLAITGRPMLGFFSLTPVRNTSTEGICACKNKNTGGYHNVALVTLFPFNNKLTNEVAIVAVAREIGHAFGSDIDPKNKECRSSSGGNFIMQRRLPEEMATNSKKFSPCSKRQIREKLKKLPNCFIAQEDFKSCGNGLRDSPTEQCDCGNPTRCAEIDTCCIPAGKPNECTYSNTSQCSYRNNACCTSECTLVDGDEKLWCNHLDHCKLPSYCDGVDKDCPSSPGLEMDGVKCRQGIGHCFKGECIADGCYLNDAVECMPSTVEDACFLSCMKRHICLPAYKWGIYNTDYSKIVLPDGEPCWGVASYCQSGVCEQDTSLEFPKPENIGFPDEPLDRPLNFVIIIFSVLFILVVVLLVGIFVYVCLPS